MHRRHVAVVGAADRFAVEGEVLAQVGASLNDPLAEDGLEGVHIEATEESGVGGRAGGLSASESEGEGEGLPVIATELNDALEGGAAGEHGDDREAEDRRQIVDFPSTVARVGNTGEHLSERLGHRRTSEEWPALPPPTNPRQPQLRNSPAGMIRTARFALSQFPAGWYTK